MCENCMFKKITLFYLDRYIFRQIHNGLYKATMRNMSCNVSLIIHRFLIVYLLEWICNAMGNKTPAAL